ncbi:YceH family protein [Telmatobacter bradus]|uniref:YceH family protein n=1 Tax=Telmatobacter bradus TaxID=474953 RepID=UPI003B436403
MSQDAIVLSVVEARVLGALVEKEVTTPEYYPLSLNALVNACNQRSNREPVMNLDEDEVRQALRGLSDNGLAGAARSDGRVARYEHHLGEVFNFTRAETALMTVLLLRGAQTPGELRGRTERLFSFDEISDVLGGLQKLAERDPALVALLPRQPGARESRYAQLLSGPVESAVAQAGNDFAGNTERIIPPAIAPAAASAYEERIAQLEATVAELRQQFEGLQQKIDSLFG